MKKEVKKLSLNKLTISKLDNLKIIKAGNGPLGPMGPMGPMATMGCFVSLVGDCDTNNEADLEDFPPNSLVSAIGNL